MCNELLLDTDVLVMQDEQLSNWKKKKTFTTKDGKKVKHKSGGKKIQHGILGRVKARLKNKPNVHVINKWVPTTKLCTNCGKTYDITLDERHYKCPHCGHDDGDRDCHSAKNMAWLYEHMPNLIGLDGAEFTRGDFDEGLSLRFSDGRRPSEG